MLRQLYYFFFQNRRAQDHEKEKKGKLHMLLHLLGKECKICELRIKNENRLRNRTPEDFQLRIRIREYLLLNKL